MNLVKSLFGPMLIIGLGGTGRETIRWLMFVLRSLGLDPVNGPVRLMVVDVPEPQGLDGIPFVSSTGAPIGEAVKGAKTGGKKGLAGYPWLAGQPTPSEAQVVDGAGMNTRTGRFGFVFNVAEFRRLVTKQLNDLMAFPEISEQFTIATVNSLAGGSGSSSFIDAMQITLEILGSLNTSMPLRTRSYALVLGPDSFLPITDLHDELRRNTGEAVQALEALWRGDLTGRTMDYAQAGGGSVATVEIEKLPFKGIIAASTTRNGQSHLGDPKTAANMLGNLCLMLAHRGLSQQLKEQLRNLEEQPSFSRIARVGWELELPLAGMKDDLLVAKTAAGAFMAPPSTSVEAADWVSRVLGHPLVQLPDAMGGTGFINHPLVLKVLNEKDWDDERTARLVTTLFGNFNGQLGIVDDCRAQATRVIEKATGKIAFLDNRLRREIQASASPADLRAWTGTVHQLRLAVEASIKALQETRRSVGLYRAAADKQLPSDSDKSDPMRWSKWAEGKLRNSYKGKGWFRGNPDDWATQYIEAVTLDVTRIIEDERFDAILRALTSLQESLKSTYRWLSQLVTSLNDCATALESEATEIMAQMSTVDSADPLARVAGLTAMDAVFETASTALIRHTLTNVKGYSVDAVRSAARAAVVAVSPTMPRAYVNGETPEQLWATTPMVKQAPIHTFRFRINPHGAEVEPVTGVIEIDGGVDIAASLVYSAGYRWDDLAGILAARRAAANSTHPYVDHALLLDAPEA